MLTKGAADNAFEGIKVSRTGPSVSHLFFADDSLIFFKASPKACEGIKNILDKFSRLSGEVINFHKSLIMFSPNTPPSCRFQMRSIVNTPSAEALGKYLGNNIEVNGRSSRMFLPLVEKVEKRLSSWHNLSLSLAGRVILINSVLSMLSLNILSVFLIPKLTADKLNSIFARFLWAGSRATKPIFWKGRTSLELPKGSGGLGIRNVHLFNKALLAKQAVRIHHASNSLIAQVYHAKYKTSPVNFSLNKFKLSRATWGFQGLCRAVQDCQEGFVKIIGDGSDTQITEDKWLRGDPIKVKPGIILQEQGLQTVSNLIISERKAWNTELIWKTFLPETSIRILSTYIPKESFKDYYAWSESKHGSINVKDVYIFYLKQKGALEMQQNRRKFWNNLWASDLRPKWKIFVWRILQRALATNTNLSKRNIPVNETCHFCHRFRENETHLFRDCDISSRIWSASTLGISTHSSRSIPIDEWIRNFLQLFWKEDGRRSERVREFVVTLWSIWLHRNNVVFRNLFEDPLIIIHRKNIILREFDESDNIKGNHLKITAPSSITHQGPLSSLIESRHRDICVILVDGAWKRYQEKHPRAGIGWIAHVNGRKVFEGNAAVITTSSLQTEALAVHKGLWEAHSRNIRSIQILSDSTDIVRAMSSQQHAFEIISIMHDIKAICRGFQHWEIKKVNRNEINLAHNLAVSARLGKLV
ncbi:uncharacterized protein LOC125493701 [Beta vulgaris subsp. vulgaris]|uniref:uncharacterized protein LOC125493701 n=1 Tax=Beta vulgaris subsp. vulgaris TaxID=3555 RepID=UPI00203679D8|nr:uncharacterized protein LOC125493701 [Beta vulgaris subsp. vulgaris]